MPTRALFIFCEYVSDEEENWNLKFDTAIFKVQLTKGKNENGKLCLHLVYNSSKYVLCDDNMNVEDIFILITIYSTIKKMAYFIRMMNI